MGTGGSSDYLWLIHGRKASCVDLRHSDRVPMPSELCRITSLTIRRAKGARGGPRIDIVEIFKNGVIFLKKCDLGRPSFLTALT